MRTPSRILDWVLPVLGIFVLLGCWHTVSSAQWLSPVFLPSPERSFRALWEGLKSGYLLHDMGATTLRMLEAWTVASIFGILLGIVIGTFPRLRAYVEPTLEFLRPLPASALVPFAIAAFGLTNQMILAVIAFGSLWPAMLATIHGFAKVSPRLLEVARLLGLSQLAVLKKIMLPSSVTDILAGLRLGLTVALILTVVGEMLSGQDGLGQRILRAARSFRAADLYASLILLGGLGLLSNGIFESIERRWARR